jgi:Tannase-like family of unknown function (DUF6351)
MSAIAPVARAARRSRPWAAVAAVVTLCGLVTPAAAQAQPPSRQQFALSVLSSRPDQVTAGDALVRVDVPHTVPLHQVTVLRNGVDVTAAFAPAADGRALEGLVEGFDVGDNELVAQPNGRGRGRPDPARLEIPAVDHVDNDMVDEDEPIADALETISAEVEAALTPQQGEVGLLAELHDESRDAGTGRASTLLAYSEWDTQTPLSDLLNARLDDVIDGLVRIAEVEGPVLGHRLYLQYVRSAGGRRVGRKIASVLNKASHAAVRRGLLLASDPLDEGGQKWKTFRVPGQPEIRLRQLGPRTLSDIPPAELAGALQAVRLQDGATEEAWFRAVLDRYGLVRLTQPGDMRLRRCARLLDNPR